MADWDGKSRGTVFGLKVFVFFIKHFGVTAAYALLCLPVPYFVVFAPKATRNLYRMYTKRLGYSKFKAAGNVIKTFFVFGQTLIDRIAVTVGHRKQFTYEFDGIQHIENVLEQGKGAILFTGHIGNFNISRSFFTELKHQAKVNMVVTDQEHEHIKNYLTSVTGKTHINFIVVEDEFSHIFKINAALQNNELIVFAADRNGEGKTISTDFLGKSAQFFEGPFKLAAKVNRPILFVYIMREKGYHYHLSARPCEQPVESTTKMLHLYTENLAQMVKKYPNQWFNFYDYWDEFSTDKKHA